MLCVLFINMITEYRWYLKTVGPFLMFSLIIFCGSLSSYLNCTNHIFNHISYIHIFIIHVCTLKTRQLRIKPLFCLNEEWCGKSTKSSNCFGWCISTLFTTFHIYHHLNILRWRFLRELWCKSFFKIMTRRCQQLLKIKTFTPLYPL